MNAAEQRMSMLLVERDKNIHIMAEMRKELSGRLQTPRGKSNRTPRLPGEEGQVDSKIQRDETYQESSRRFEKDERMKSNADFSYEAVQGQRRVNDPNDGFLERQHERYEYEKAESALNDSSEIHEVKKEETCDHLLLLF